MNWDAEDVDVDVGHRAVHGIDHVTVEVDNRLVPLPECREYGQKVRQLFFLCGGVGHILLTLFLRTL